MPPLLRLLARTALACLALTAALLAQAAVPTVPSRVTVVGRQIFVERSLTTGRRPAELFTIAGLCWNPTPVGQNNAPDWAGTYVADLELMRSMNANTVRLYSPLPLTTGGTAIMDKCYELGLYVIMPVPYSTTPNATVTHFKNHPALLMFEVGNEWNYNYGYNSYSSNQDLAQAAAAVNNRAGIIQSLDGNHPVSSSLGHANDSDATELPGVPGGVFALCTNVDVWGFNTYMKGSFETSIAEALTLTTKPIYFSEFGTDAYNAITQQEDQAEQAGRSAAHWESIRPKLTINGGQFSGGCVFAFNDGWWKMTDPSKHDTTGITSNPGNYYDGSSNEEWYGVVDINRVPRLAYTSYQNAWGDLPLNGSVYWGRYKILNKLTARTLRTQNSATASGTLIVQDNWGASMFSTQWNIESLPDDTYRIHNVHTYNISGQRLPLRPASASSANNIQLAQYSPDGTAWQRWRIQPSGADGFLKFKNVQTGKVIRVKDGATALGTPIVQFDDTGLDSSRWMLTR